MKEIIRVFLAATKLGLVSFGGPAAHIGYFYDEYVRRRKWLDAQSYADLTALCQFLPGPASSQAGIGIGMMRAGFAGGIAAWLGFTWPSALLMIGFALGLDRWADRFGGADAGWLHGLKLVAVAVVAQAVWSMGRQLAADRPRAAMAVGAAVLVTLWPAAASQWTAILAGGLIGALALRHAAAVGADAGGGRMAAEGTPPKRAPLSRPLALCCLALAALLLFALPLANSLWPGQTLAMFDAFYRAGALVFGGGHVVLPLLEKETVAAGWVEPGRFLAGYGAAQALPGPLFTFAAFLGMEAGGWAGALTAIIGIFLPGFLLVAGALPFWDALRRLPRMRAALAGVNAAVVGVLLAALYHPIWTSTVRAPEDFALAAALFGALAYLRCPPWLLVVLGAAAGEGLALAAH